MTYKFIFSDHNRSTKIQSKLIVEPDTRRIFINKGKTTTLIIDNYLIDLPQFRRTSYPAVNYE